MLVTNESTNYSDILHGGMTATIVDQISSLALTTALLSEPSPDEKMTRIASVSIELSISYMSPIKLGQTILIEANTLKYGKSIAFLNVDIFNKETLKLVANAKHTKYILGKPSL
jgi:acyl-coenzyme A thioesterase 13